MIKEAIVKIVDKQDLTYDEAYAVMTEPGKSQAAAPPSPSPSTASLWPSGTVFFSSPSWRMNRAPSTAERSSMTCN